MQCGQTLAVVRWEELDGLAAAEAYQEVVVPVIVESGRHDA
jgi:hypothetical protein